MIFLISLNPTGTHVKYCIIIQQQATDLYLTSKESEGKACKCNYGLKSYFEMKNTAIIIDSKVKGQS